MIKYIDSVGDLIKHHILSIGLWVRVIITVGVIYWIYQETGPAVAIFATLMFIQTEIAGFLHKVHIFTNKTLAEAISVLIGKH